MGKFISSCYHGRSSLNEHPASLPLCSDGTLECAGDITDKYVVIQQRSCAPKTTCRHHGFQLFKSHRSTVPTGIIQPHSSSVGTSQYACFCQSMSIDFQAHICNEDEVNRKYPCFVTFNLVSGNTSSCGQVCNVTGGNP